MEVLKLKMSAFCSSVSIFLTYKGKPIFPQFSEVILRLFFFSEQLAGAK